MTACECCGRREASSFFAVSVWPISTGAIKFESIEPLMVCERCATYVTALVVKMPQLADIADLLGEWGAE